MTKGIPQSDRAAGCERRCESSSAGKLLIRQSASSQRRSGRRKKGPHARHAFRRSKSVPRSGRGGRSDTAERPPRLRQEQCAPSKQRIPRRRLTFGSRHLGTICGETASSRHPRRAAIIAVALSEVTRILSAIEHVDPSSAGQSLPLVDDELTLLAAWKKQ